MLLKVRRALDYLFIQCTSIGAFDNADGRRFKAVLLVATWLFAIVLTILAAISFWLYDFMGPIRQWAQGFSGPKVPGLVAALVIGIPALMLSTKIGQRSVGRIAPRATFRKSLVIGLWYMAVLMSILLNLNRYGALVALGLHLVFLAWLIYASKQVEAQG
ncbi:hypothetical protein SAMN04487785_10432 [Dyella jiangningensis]|uniref:hypothetical protein n=1 Tax=Dyella sp. AtDHG13 TaxID=1938897 RepID=UPI00087F1549|nr:hypothetical protein [Dyella sp. AtDHG13]PXV58787.1 hypothetical protein BDW41_105301 [Dyella sp. AtDHG13]SDJ82424.1 hypothetical protein SAMN04487785_10432 [Dyella jiangningensis]